MSNSKAKPLLDKFRGVTLIRKRSFLAALLTLALTPAAHASVIQNGSFETDPLAPWATTGLYTAGIGANISPPDGTRIGVVGTAGGDTSGSFFQNFNLADAGMFDYAFRVGRSEGACGCNDVPLTFTARIDDIILSTELPAFSSSGSGGHFFIELPSSYAGSLFLSSGAHILSFDLTRGFNLFGRAPYFAFDGVGVTPQEVVVPPPPSATDVPEPLTLSLFTSGLGAIGLLARRRKQGRSTLAAA